MIQHDYKNFPELTNAQLNEFGFMSPHKQITEDFDAICVKVKDGDTITLRTTFRDFDFPLRFLDIDSPEMSQGGELAKEWLRSQIEGNTVTVQIDYNNRVGRYGRLMGRVLYRGLNMGDTQIRLGLAVPFGKKNEEVIPSLHKEFDIKKWLTI
jgi:endonuclease YncB( thermonuclease family)